MIETGLIVVSAIILVILAVPLYKVSFCLTVFLMPMTPNLWKSLDWIDRKLMVPLLSM